MLNSRWAFSFLVLILFTACPTEPPNLKAPKRDPEQAPPPKTTAKPKIKKRRKNRKSRLPEKTKQSLESLFSEPTQAEDAEKNLGDQLSSLRERLPKLKKIVEKLRGETLTIEVDIVLWNEAKHKDWARGRERTPTSQHLLKSLGLASRQALEARLQDFVQSEDPTCAFYYPPEKTIVLLPRAFNNPRKSPRLGETFDLDRVVIHELVHALQHQRFPKIRFQQRNGMLEPEGCMENWLLEGEATFVANLYFCQKLNNLGLRSGDNGGKRFKPELFLCPAEINENWKMLEILEENLKSLPSESEDKSSPEFLRKHHEQLRKTRDFLRRRDLLYDRYLPIEPYCKGAFLITEVYDKGGWAAVDALFKRPPESTELALHPEKLLAPERDLPVRLNPLILKNKRLIAQAIVGERNLRIIFESLSGVNQDKACTGWDGDLAQLFQEGDKQSLVWQSVWDSTRDAEEFLLAMKKYRSHSLGLLHNSKIQRRGKHVLLVAGLPSPQIKQLLGQLK